jgi:hypothetical protein
VAYRQGSRNADRQLPPSNILPLHLHPCVSAATRGAEISSELRRRSLFCKKPWPSRKRLRSAWLERLRARHAAWTHSTYRLQLLSCLGPWDGRPRPTWRTLRATTVHGATVHRCRRSSPSLRSASLGLLAMPPRPGPAQQLAGLRRTHLVHRVNMCTGRTKVFSAVRLKIDGWYSLTLLFV